MKQEKPKIVPGDGDPRHGTVNGYRNLGCTGECCKAAAKGQKQGLPDDDPRHGTTNGYGNYGCRCTPCTKAWSDDQAARRQHGTRRRLASV